MKVGKDSNPLIPLLLMGSFSQVSLYEMEVQDYFMHWLITELLDGKLIGPVTPPHWAHLKCDFCASIIAKQIPAKDASYQHLIEVAPMILQSGPI